MVLGLLWPIEGAHEFVRLFNWFFPLSEAVDAARGIGSKQFDLFHPVVMRGFAGIIIWNLIFIFLVYIYLKLKKDVFSSAVKAIH